MVAVAEARRAAPAVLFLPNVRLWWEAAQPMLQATLTILLEARAARSRSRLSPRCADRPCVLSIVGHSAACVRAHERAAVPAWC